MSNPSLSPPVLLVHPNRDEARSLIERIESEGISRNFVAVTDLDSARDYLDAAIIAGEPTFAPCALLLDEQLDESDRQDLEQWIRRTPMFRETHIATVSSDAARPDAWNTSQAVRGELRALAQMLAHACSSGFAA